MMQWRWWRSPLASTVVAVVGGALYGLGARLAFVGSPWADLLGTLSIGFLCLVPVGIGVLTVVLAPAQQRTSLAYAAFMPWAACTLFVFLVALFSREAWICILMALPIFGLMSSVGGLVAAVLFLFLDRIGSGPAIGALLMLVSSPYLTTPLENRIPLPDSIRTASSAMVIASDAATVWSYVTRFPAVQDAERHFSWYHLAGLPRPVEATLSAPGVGGLRQGQWEYGLVFNGAITEWTPERSFTVQLEADTRVMNGTTLPLREIGGKYFDVVADSYVIEPLADGRVRLHLLTTYRLTTRLNGYGGLWTDFFMRDIQHDLLSIVKARSEAKP